MPTTKLPLRGPPRVSHLRQWSTGSPEAERIDSIEPPPRPCSTASSFVPVQKLCQVWVHDESFSKEDILFNASTLGEGCVQNGDLVAVSAVALSSVIQQFEPVTSAQKKHASLVEAEAAASHVASISRGGGGNRHVIDKKSLLFVVKDLSPEVKARYPNLQISVTTHIASAFGFRNRSQVVVSTVNKAGYAASHVELTFRDAYLARADMWRLAISELAGSALYSGQKIVFMGTIKTTIKNIYIDGQRVQSAFFSPTTIPVFRSESARYVLFIQMSKEMWDFDSEGSGEIMFNRVINGFLPELFKRWAKINAHHLVSIVMFTRFEYTPEPASHLSDVKSVIPIPDLMSASGSQKTRDFYRVVVSDVASIRWTNILDQLKREFRVFLRDVSLQQRFDVANKPSEVQNGDDNHYGYRICGQPSTAPRGNILEAINLAYDQYSFDYIDRDLVRTGISVVVITPGTGVFEVDSNLLALTTERLVDNAMGIDLVCLSRMPLHSVPLFMFKPFEAEKPPIGLENLDESVPIGRPPANSYSSHLSNQFGGVSPTIFHYGTSPIPSKSGDQNETQREWSFVIPHWIDVSFWNSDANSYGHRFSSSYLGYSNSSKMKGVKPFVPRVRMYELQMMGVTETDMRSIRIPYLGEQLKAAREKCNSSSMTQATTSDKKQGTRDEQAFGYDESLVSKQPILEHLSLASSLSDDKHVRMKYSSDQISWLDEYDNRIFHGLGKKASKSVSTSAGKLSSKYGTRRSKDGAISSLDTSPRGYLTGKSKSIHLSSPPEGSSRGRGMMSKQITRMGGSKSQTRVKDFGAARPSVLSRQISFGVNGLMIGGDVPKALASTELASAHARPGRPSLNKRVSSQRATANGSEQSDIAEKLKIPGSNTHQPSGSLKVTSVVAKGANHNLRPPSFDGPDSENLSTSKPIDIKLPFKKLDGRADRSNEVSILSHLGSLERSDQPSVSALQFATRARHSGRRPERYPEPNTQTEPSTSALSPTKALLPWLTPINPANPKKDENYSPLKFGTWQHVQPRRIPTSVIKWKSLCSPAALPLTTEDFPTQQQLGNEYTESPYRIAQDDEKDNLEFPKTREHLMREFISFRLSRGFQIVVGSAAAEALGQPLLEDLNIFDNKYISMDGALIVMTKGSKIHKLLCVSGGEIEITILTRRPMASLSKVDDEHMKAYSPNVCTMMSASYFSRSMKLFRPFEPYNWNFADLYLAGYKDHLTDLTQQLRFWRARFVLIPVDPPVSSRRPLQIANEDSEEEIRLEGIFRLTQMWQRYRYVAPEEGHLLLPTRSKKSDNNPLDIVYQTRNPSDVVAAEVDNALLNDTGPEGRTVQLLPESELFERSNLSLSKLAAVMQSDKGIRMMDRRWHLRLHYNCFIGIDFTTWLLNNFRDIDTREEAVEFGNVLMEKNLFVHVEKRHNFRDGNYFYQITAEYRTPRPESRNTWFGSLKLDKPFPTTPMTDSFAKDSPRLTHSRTDSAHDTASVGSVTPTPSRSSKTTIKVALSKMMRYDVDHRRRSNRQELISLHYDRLSNPDTCYHIRIEWLSVTSKLIEDAIVTWATMAEKFGLRMVEVPIEESSSITQSHPFRAPFSIKLAKDPPEKQPKNYFDATSFTAQTKIDRHFYQKAILRRFNFVLDFEAAADFPPNVEVTYSWGKPHYQYPQYIHRSGTVLAQITNDGKLLLLANRLYNNRSATSKAIPGNVEREERRRAMRLAREALERFSPTNSPLVRAVPDSVITNVDIAPMTPQDVSPEQITENLNVFCQDVDALEKFYGEILTSAMTPISAMNPLSVPESSIPPMGLPPSMIGRDLYPLRTDAASSPRLRAVSLKGEVCEGANSPRSIGGLDR